MAQKNGSEWSELEWFQIRNWTPTVPPGATGPLLEVREKEQAEQAKQKALADAW